MCVERESGRPMLYRAWRGPAHMFPCTRAKSFLGSLNRRKSHPWERCPKRGDRS